MRSNPWLKLAGVSLAGMILSFTILWGVQQFNQYKYYNGIQMQMNGTMGNMQMNGNWNMQGNMNNDSNMQGNMNMNNNSNMQGGMMKDKMMNNMNNMNNQGSSNMQGGMMDMMMKGMM